MTALPVALDIDGVAAPPRANGELVFAEPWESRIFGVTLSLYEAGYFEWAAFQRELIAAIASWEADHAPDADYRYYACWLRALESLLEQLNVVQAAQIRARIAEHLARPPGHDHDHGDHDEHDPDHHRGGV